MRLIDKTKPPMVAGFHACYFRLRARGAGAFFDPAAGAPEVCPTRNEKINGSLRWCRVVLTVGVLGLILGGCGGGGGVPAPTRPAEVDPVPMIDPALEASKREAEAEARKREFEVSKREFEASPEYHVVYGDIERPPVRLSPTIVITSVVLGGTDTHLSRIKAAAAYARGATGMGETITIADTGIRETHREFSGVGKTSKETLSGYTPTDEQKLHGTAIAALAIGNRDGSSGNNMHGVAYDANMHFIEIPLDMLLLPSLTDDAFAGFLDTLIEKTSGNILNLSFGYNIGAISDFSEFLIRYAVPLTAASLEQKETSAAEKKIIVWAAGNNGWRTSGRFGFDSPEYFAGIGAYFTELSPHVLAVVALDQDGSIAGYSNRCGIAKSFCLAAPGSAILSASSVGDMGYDVMSGTSTSAPLVSGALAVLRQFFRDQFGNPQLGNTELVARLLATADKTGIYADSDIYGAGLLDLDAATRPDGQTVLFTGTSFNGPAVAEALSSLTGGAAFGDSLARGLANLEIAAFDALDAPFFRPLGAYLRAPAAVHARLEDRLWTLGANPRGSLVWAQPGAELRIRFEQAADPRQAGGSRAYHEAGATFGQTLGALSFTGQVGGKPVFFGFRQHPGWRLGLRGAGIVRPGTFSDDSAFASPYLALARNGGSAGLTWPLATGSLRAVAFRGGAQWGERRDPDTSHALGAVLEYQFTGRVRAGAASGLALQVGWLREPKRLIGSRTQGAFDALNGGTGFAGMSAHARIGSRWSVFAATHLGWSHPQVVGQGLLQDVSPLVSSAFSVGMAGGEFWQRDDRLSLRVSQPLRVEAGHAAFRWVAGRTRHRQVRLREATLNLVPSARQLDVELAYVLPVGATGPGEQRTGALNLAALASHHPNHSRTATEYALLFRYQQTF